MDITHIAAFLSGIAAVLSSIAAIRMIHKRAERDCNRRIEEIRRSIHEGFQMGREE